MKVVIFTAFFAVFLALSASQNTTESVLPTTQLTTMKVETNMTTQVPTTMTTTTQAMITTTKPPEGSKVPESSAPLNLGCQWMLALSATSAIASKLFIF